MTRTILSWLLAGLAILSAVPALMGLVDMWSWVVLGHSVTGTDWTGIRSEVATWMGAAAFGLAAAAGAVAAGGAPSSPRALRCNENPQPGYGRPPMPAAPSAWPHIPQTDPERRGWNPPPRKP